MAAFDALLAEADFSDRACDVEPGEPAAGGLLTAAFHPLLRAAAQFLDEPRPVAWLSGARRGLLGSLGRRWVACAHTVLYAELRAAGLAPSRFIEERLSTRQDWLALLARFPVVAALLNSSWSAWRREIDRLAQRLAADAPALALGAPLTVAELTVHAGEYEGRRWTMSLALDGGRRLLYRPRDLRIVPWFLEVCALLNESLSTPLHQRRVLALGDHAWDEFVAAAPCRDAGEVTRFYRRMGVLMRLLQLLRATDMHVHNLIGAGEHPVIIDVETLLQPVVGESARERARLRTPLDTGLLPFWITGDPGRRAAEGSALGTGKSIAMPYRVPCLLAPESPLAGFARDYAPPRPAPSILPIVDGKMETPGNHLDAILDGYVELDEILTREDRLDALLARAAELPVRAFVRPNIVYKRAQFEGLAPSLLRDPARRAIALARMLGGPGGERFSEDPLLRSELQTLGELRHPRFWSLPGDDALLCADGGRVAGFFRGRALACVERRQEPRQREQNLDCIRSAIALADPLTPPPAPRPTSRASSPRAAALALADRLLDDAITDGDEMHFLGAVWMPWAAARPLALLPNDLLSGNAGLAIVLAAAHRQSGLARFRVAAESALRPIRRAVERELPSLAAFAGDPSRYPARWLFCGAFHGLGAQAFALARCRALLDGGDDTLAADLVRHFPVALAPRCTGDLALGLPGFLLVASGLGALPPALSALVEVAAALPPPPFPDGTPDFLPSPALSLALLRQRLEGATCDAAPGPLLYRAACDPACEAELDAALAFGSPSLASTSPSLASVSPSLEQLELALSRPRFSSLATEIAEGILSRRAQTGRWLEGAVADRHHLSALTGLGALAYALLRLEAPTLGSLRLLA